MLGSRRWCALINDPREETGVVIGGDESHVFQNLRDQVVTVLELSTQDVQCFIEYP